MTTDVRLESLRQQIDELDGQLISLLAQRMLLSRQIGLHKRQAGLPALQPQRFSQLLQRLREQAAQQQLNPDFVDALYQLIHQESLRCQQ